MVFVIPIALWYRVHIIIISITILSFEDLIYYQYNIVIFNLLQYDTSN